MITRSRPLNDTIETGCSWYVLVADKRIERIRRVALFLLFQPETLISQDDELIPRRQSCSRMKTSQILKDRRAEKMEDRSDMNRLETLNDYDFDGDNNGGKNGLCRIFGKADHDVVPNPDPSRH